MTDRTNDRTLGLLLLAGAGLLWFMQQQKGAAASPAAQPYGDPTAPIVSRALPGLEHEATYTATQIRRHQNQPGYHGGF